MTRPLRRFHRFTFLGLAVLLPLLFGAGLRSRRPLVQVEVPSERIHLITPNGTEIAADSRELWGKAIEAPDPLVYWVEDDPDRGTLPANAHLLGSLTAGARNSLRIPQGRKRGILILYSLAHREVVARAAVPKEMV